MFDRAAPVTLVLALIAFGTEGLAQQPPSPDFDWGAVVDHPLAGPGQALAGLPDGNYLVPTEDSEGRCNFGCAFYALSGAIAIQMKIENRDPGATVDLSERAFLDEHGVQIGAPLCEADCTAGTTASVGCIADLLKTEGLQRVAFLDDPRFTNVRYRIAPDGFDSFRMGDDFEPLRQRILRGPVIATIETLDAESARKKLVCRAIPGSNMGVGEHVHHVLIVGYNWSGPWAPNQEWRPRIHIMDALGKTDYNFSRTIRKPFSWPCIKTNLSWYQVLDVVVDGMQIDTDVDGIPDPQDACIDRMSSRGVWPQANLDGDEFGDPCDADMDGDGVLDAFDCSPFNRYVGVDLDQDGHCDNPEIGRFFAGPPFPQFQNNRGDWPDHDNLLRTPALIDYKDHPTYADWGDDLSVNDLDAIADGENEPGVDVPVVTVCRNACDRLAALDVTIRPSRFDLSVCRDRCDPAVTPWDTCTPLSSYGAPEELYEDCRRLALNGVTTHRSGYGPNEFRPAAWYADDLAGCKTFWFNPGDGQRDADGDGDGDFCDAEPTAANIEVSQDTQAYHTGGPDGLGVQISAIQCYADQVDVRYDTWGGRRVDGVPFGVDRSVAIEACQCPYDLWLKQCSAYCPSDGEYPSSGDSAHNPGADNRAWDAINSPATCGPPAIRRDASIELCTDETTHFLGRDYGRSPTETHHWRWSPFYDPDRADGTSFAEHPSPAFDENDPRQVRLRVAATGDGTTSHGFAEPFRVRQGCNGLPQAVVDAMRSSPRSMLGLPTVAYALADDYLITVNPTTGALREARPRDQLGDGAFARGGHLALGFMDGAHLTMFEGAVAEQAMPVAYYHDGSSLWLGALWSNQWVQWNEHFRNRAPDVAAVGGLVGGAAGEVRLLALDAERNQWTVYEGHHATWRVQARFDATALDPSDRDFTVVPDGTSRALFLFGGHGDARARRLDLLAGRVTTLGSADWPLGSIVGAYRSGDVVYLVGEKVARFDVVRAQLEVLDLPAFAELTVRPYIHWDDNSQTLSVMDLGDGPAEMLTARPGQRTWTVRPVVDDGTSTGDQPRGGTFEAGDRKVIAFVASPENHGLVHRAVLTASSDALGLILTTVDGTELARSMESTTENEIVFTPEGSERYLFHVVAVEALATTDRIDFVLAIDAKPPATSGDGGCGCGTSDGGVPTLALLGLLAVLRRR